MSPNRNISRPRRCLPDNRARLLTCQTSSRARHTRLSDHFGRRAAAVECVGRRVRAPTTSSVPGRPRPLRHLVSAGAYIIIRRARYIVRRPYRCTYRVSTDEDTPQDSPPQETYPWIYYAHCDCLPRQCEDDRNLLFPIITDWLHPSSAPIIKIEFKGLLLVSSRVKSDLTISNYLERKII